MASADTTGKDRQRRVERGDRPDEPGEWRQWDAEGGEDEADPGGIADSRGEQGIESVGHRIRRPEGEPDGRRRVAAAARGDRRWDGRSTRGPRSAPTGRGTGRRLRGTGTAGEVVRVARPSAPSGSAAGARLTSPSAGTVVYGAPPGCVGPSQIHDRPSLWRGRTERPVRTVTGGGRTAIAGLRCASTRRLPWRPQPPRDGRRARQATGSCRRMDATRES